jgi:hypothetical protein
LSEKEKEQVYWLGAMGALATGTLVMGALAMGALVTGALVGVRRGAAMGAVGASKEETMLKMTTMVVPAAPVPPVLA